MFYPLGLVGVAFLIPAMLLIVAGIVHGLVHRRQPALLWAMLLFTPVYLPCCPSPAIGVFGSGIAIRLFCPLLRACCCYERRYRDGRGRSIF